MTVPTYIKNHKAVIEFFGGWPSFHDANVRDYRPPTSASQSLTFTLHTWLMTDGVDEKGFIILRNHALVSFYFTDLVDVEMDVFKSENILFGLEFTPVDNSGSFRVTLNSVMDMSGSFSARSGEVISLKPCAADGNDA